ncbi:hypothetical protein TpMuguga_01g00246 [Theileria parva strain Muguga]|uniref:Uncharacterized protein n=1 Tax=Theileria parva TaxID=5875 RepID=Q4N968_THEPA|nr:uncharacterized protein TpMuguga_01g00246 [Theileria parva strain Muguga]EAN33490.1 hypothetical protein TpMuguga_01g00246 [Theileria parva strain Muguga]|eukprot:XP_765773.1 hypothetical protein [Theileria parva strain Muguga]
MAQDVLKNITDRLDNTIKETNDFFKSLSIGNVSGAKLKILKDSEVDAPDKKWVLPYTLPVLKALTQGTAREGDKPIVLPAPVLTGRAGNVSSFQTTTRENPEYPDLNTSKYEEKYNSSLEGWTERQKRFFYRFAADSEKKMRQESLRLQDEYNKQLATKLAMVKNELYETNRKNLLELQEMKLERERWLLDESDTKNSLEKVSSAFESLQKSYDNLRLELDEREFKISNLNGELSKNERLLNALRSDNEALQTELHGRSELISRLQTDVADAYLRLENETTKSANLEQELYALNQEKKDLLEVNKDLKAQVDSLLLSNKFLLNEKESLENRKCKLEQDVSDLNRTVYSQQNLLRSFEISESSKITALEEKVNTLQNQLKRAQIDLLAADNRPELESLTREVNTLRAHVKQLNADNDAMFKENSIILKKLDQEKALVKEHLNELYVTKCKANNLRHQLKSLLQTTSRNNDTVTVSPELLELYKEKLAETNSKKEKPKDLFQPTMFDGPDDETQIKIDDLEKELTELYLEKDRLESEMIRCNLGPGSPSRVKRQHFLLEGKLAETRKKINELSTRIKQLYKK